MNIQISLSQEDVTTLVNALDQYIEWAAEDEETAGLVADAQTLLDRLLHAPPTA
jgi:hypothetical protein